MDSTGLARIDPEPGGEAAMKSILTRARRRFQIGKAYCMAKEIAPHLPAKASIVDIGCGSGFIAFHLRGLRGGEVMGVDVLDVLQAPIPFQPFDGQTLPFTDSTFDAALFCYVLHHTREPQALLAEARRVVRPGGVIVIYEDVPHSWWDWAFAWRHSLAWTSRTGPCRFRSFLGWQELFGRLRLSVRRCRLLSRWRNLGHPVQRAFYVLQVP